MSVLWDNLRINGVCELDNGTHLTGAQLRKMACEADIIPIVLSGDGVPLDMGRLARLATYKQRLALRVLHPTCAVEGCDMDFDWCDIHHLKPWERHGLTDLDNLVPVCDYHHTWLHDLDGNVMLEMLPDRTLRVPGLPDALRKPRKTPSSNDSSTHRTLSTPADERAPRSPNNPRRPPAVLSAASGPLGLPYGHGSTGSLGSTGRRARDRARPARR